jgi:hypothetical protein
MNNGPYATVSDIERDEGQAKILPVPRRSASYATGRNGCPACSSNCANASHPS